VIALPPLSVGVVKLTLACALPAVATTLPGAEACVAGVTAVDATLAGPLPLALRALTVKL
jgi:hypothetical protein